MATEQELNDFLASVDKRAFLRAAFSTRDDDAAMDLVQDAMISLATKYADRPREELPLLFQRILTNAILDWHRKRKVRSTLFSNLSDFDTADSEGDFDLLETLQLEQISEHLEGADSHVQRMQILKHLETEISRLPARQREAFLLRYWEELDVAETAQAMGCSEGSVKTHCSRAIHTLARALKAQGYS
ncbi:MAG: RNA polymerase sigma factor [Thiomonas sp.]